MQEIEKAIKEKQDYHSRTLEKVRIKCQGQFETQRQAMNKYSQISDARLNRHSEIALKKFQSQQEKSRELNERTNNSIERHRQKNYDRFYTRDEGLKKAKQEREDFLKSEARRHNSKLKARESILNSLSIEHAQKSELNSLRVLDA